MLRALAAALLVLAAALLLVPSPRARFVQLAPGTVEIHQEMVLEDNTEMRGAASGSVLRAAADFHGRALIVVRGNRVLLRDFDVDGNREKLESRLGLPGYDVPFARFTPANGVLADGVFQLAIRNVRFREIAGFAVLVSRSRQIAIDSRTCGRQRLAQPGRPQQHHRRHPAGRGHERFPRHALRVAQHTRQRNLDPLALHVAAQRPRRLRGESLRHHRPRRTPGRARDGSARGRKYRHAHRLSTGDGGRRTGRRGHRGQRGPLVLRAQSVFRQSTENASISTDFTMARSAATSARMSPGTASS